MMSPRTSRVWFWALTAAALLYTALLSWWSPLTSDAYHHALTGMEHCFSFSLVWERCVASYMTWNPRIGEYLAFAVATAGKWLFMLAAFFNIFKVKSPHIKIGILGIDFLFCVRVGGNHSKSCPYPAVRNLKWHLIRNAHRLVFADFLIRQVIGTTEDVRKVFLSFYFTFFNKLLFFFSYSLK